MLLLAPDGYSEEYCMRCFWIFIVASSILLSNNIIKFNSFFLFEVLFTFSFLFINYVYPVAIYQINPYFSLFSLGFDESVITRCTALATVGFVSYSLGQFKTSKGRSFVKKSRFQLKPISFRENVILVLLFFAFLIPNLQALQSGYSTSGAGGFFYIFSIFYIYTYFAFSRGKVSRFNELCFFVIIGIYILVNLLLGNRGEPLYVCVAILLCYHWYVKRIPLKYFFIYGFIGLAIFYFVGVVRISENQVGTISREEKMEVLSEEGSVLDLANELIINNRALYVLVDYTDKKGYSYGKTWSMNIFSAIPFGQSFAKYVLEIPYKDFSTMQLNTYLSFGEDNPDAFGLGTNLIGDIYVSFGSIGVIVLMFFFGKFIKRTYENNLKGPSYSQILYIIFVILAVYFPRATLLSPVQTIAWTYVLSYIYRKRK